jgi:hypothetical protein
MHQTTITVGAARRTWTRDALLAAFLGLFLSAAWAANDWADLSRLLLPDADDMVRLAQVRDWLAGQAMNDWTQYRMAPPNGAPMHWSRLNDVGPAAMILAATPLLGRYAAELSAVLLYPGLLFFLHLFLSARIARRLWSPEAAFIAVIVGALAFPGTTIFAPGRIDHHALQTVLVQLTVLALMRAPSRVSGLAAGSCVGFSLMVGLETAPQIAALAAVLFGLWVWRGERERVRLGAFAAGLNGITVLFLLTMRPTFWSAAYCDAFTPASATGILLGGSALGFLAAVTSRLRDRRARLLIGGVLGGGALGTTLFMFPTCLSGPYGVVDPLLLQEFLPHIDEANGLFAQQPVSRMVGLGGLLAAGTAAALWMVARRPERWPVTLPVAAVVLTSALITLFQVRGVYIGAPLAAPVLAGLVLAARRRRTWRTPALVGAWVLSAGMCYKAIPAQLERIAEAVPADRFGFPLDGTPQTLCNSGDTWRQVAQLPHGVVMSPTNMASYSLGATGMSTVSAGYHRNDAANVAMYRYFLGPPESARAVERGWKVDYVAFCPGDFEEIEIRSRYPRSLGALLANGGRPPHYRPVPLHGTRLRLYRVPVESGGTA